MNIGEYNSYLMIDMALLSKNVRCILGEVPQLIPVLKDDAYGLGAVPIAKALCAFPEIKTFAVAHVSEGLELRRAGIGREILVMGGVLPFQIDAAVENGLTIALSRLGMAAELAEAAQGKGVRAKAQIKLDTGLHRIGIEPVELNKLIRELHNADEYLDITGAFSHFSDAGNLARDEMEYRRFLEATETLHRAGIALPLRHVASSAALERSPSYNLDAVRCGRRLYMDNPDNPTGEIAECVSWRGYITHLAHRSAGDRIGYGEGCTLERDSVIATLSVGYGDGLNESCFTTGAPVLIGGKRCKLLSCCMDQCMADVTGAQCTVGDEVTFFGSDGRGGFLSAQTVASLIGANEGCGLTSALSARVKRIYR